MVVGEDVGKARGDGELLAPRGDPSGGGRRHLHPTLVTVFPEPPASDVAITR
jgi:hypothetical protein